MAEIELFHYRSGTGFFHNLNTGIKYLSALLLSLALFNSSFRELLVFTITFIPTVFILLKPATSTLLKRISAMKGFLIFLILVAGARGFSFSGSASERWIHSSVYVWKIVLLLIIGQILISTTDPADLHGAVYRFLRRIPFLPAGPIATMLSLTISFIPLIFDQYDEIRQAAESRLAGLIKNPVKKVLVTALPLMETTLSRADEISMAMESRCYVHNPTLKESHITMRDILALLISVFLSTAIFLLKY